MFYSKWGKKLHEDINKQWHDLSINGLLKKNKNFNIIKKWKLFEVYDQENPVVIFNDDFINFGIIFSILKRRVFIIIDKHEDINKIFLFNNIKFVTFFGQRCHFDYKFLIKMNNLKLASSIITAEDRLVLIKYLALMLKHPKIKFKEYIVEDFINRAQNNVENKNDLDKLIKKIKNYDGIFFYCHGDILCANLNNIILCSLKNLNNTNNYKYKPICSISGKCFRIDRLKANNKNAYILNVNELNGKVLFINTCGGFSLYDNKYMDYPDILPLAALNSGFLVYISCFFIKNSSIDELNLYLLLLKKYRNFCLALYFLNHIFYQYMKQFKSYFMLGDAKEEFESDDKEGKYQYSITYSSDDGLKINIYNININAVIINIPINKYELFNKYELHELILFLNEKIECSLGCFHEAGEIFICIYFKNNFPENIDLYFMPMETINTQLKIIGHRLKLLGIHNHFILLQEDFDVLQHIYDQIIDCSKKINKMQSFSKLNGTKYFFIYFLINKINQFFENYEEKFLNAIIHRSIATDTHLILKTVNFILKANIQSGNNKCYLCDNNIYTINFALEENQSILYSKDICPRCEIISTRNSDMHLLKIISKKIINPGSKVSVALKYPFTVCKNIKIAIVLINTKAAYIDTFQIKPKKIFKTIIYVPNKLPEGLYYWRCILIMDGNVTISHKQVFIKNKRLLNE